jgi:hypothetical protein
MVPTGIICIILFLEPGTARDNRRHTGHNQHKSCSHGYKKSMDTMKPEQVTGPAQAVKIQRTATLNITAQ